MWFVLVLSEAVLVIVLEGPITITSTRTSTTLPQRNAVEFVSELLRQDTSRGRKMTPSAGRNDGSCGDGSALWRLCGATRPLGFAVEQDIAGKVRGPKHWTNGRGQVRLGRLEAHNA